MHCIFPWTQVTNTCPLGQLHAELACPHLPIPRVYQKGWAGAPAGWCYPREGGARREACVRLHENLIATTLRRVCPLLLTWAGCPASMFFPTVRIRFIYQSAPSSPLGIVEPCLDTSGLPRKLSRTTSPQLLHNPGSPAPGSQAFNWRALSQGPWGCSLCQPGPSYHLRPSVVSLTDTPRHTDRQRPAHWSR